mmetsp:Transcript_105685/g.298937  ORF Transcript_105685/g.298937 Transcript_105685/m.298937 type:complete len:200 (+) Transcript_105685:27-626(+)
MYVTRVIVCIKRSTSLVSTPQLKLFRLHLRFERDLRERPCRSTSTEECFDLVDFLRNPLVHLGDGHGEGCCGVLLVVDVAQVHVLHVFQVHLGLPQKLVDVLAGRVALLLRLRGVAAGTLRLLLLLETVQLVLGLLQELRRLLHELVHPSDLHLLVLGVLVLDENAGVCGPLASQEGQVHLHLGCCVVVQASHLLAHGF